MNVAASTLINVMDQSVFNRALKHMNSGTDTKVITFTSGHNDDSATAFTVPLMDTINGSDIIELSMISMTTAWRPEEFRLSQAVTIPARAVASLAIVGMSGLDLGVFGTMPAGDGWGFTLIHEPTIMERLDSSIVFPAGYDCSDQYQCMNLISGQLLDKFKPFLCNYNTWFGRVPASYRAQPTSAGPPQVITLFSSPAMCDAFTQDMSVGELAVANGTIGLKCNGFKPLGVLIQGNQYKEPWPNGWIGVYWTIALDFLGTEAFTFSRALPSQSPLYRTVNLSAAKIAMMIGCPHDILVPAEIGYLKQGKVKCPDILALVNSWTARTLLFSLSTNWTADYPGNIAAGAYARGHKTTASSVTVAGLVDAGGYNHISIVDYMAVSQLIPGAGEGLDPLPSVTTSALPNTMIRLLGTSTPAFVQAAPVVAQVNTTSAWYAEQRGGQPFPRVVRTKPLYGDYTAASRPWRFLFARDFGALALYYSLDAEVENTSAGGTDFIYFRQTPDYFMSNKELTLVLDETKDVVKVGGVVDRGGETAKLQTLFMSTASMFGAYVKQQGTSSASFRVLTGSTSGGQQPWCRVNDYKAHTGTITFTRDAETFSYFTAPSFQTLQLTPALQPYTLTLVSSSSNTFNSLSFKIVNEFGETPAKIGNSSTATLPTTQLVLAYRLWPGQRTMNQPQLMQRQSTFNPPDLLGSPDMLRRVRRALIKRRARRVT